MCDLLQVSLLLLSKRTYGLYHVIDNMLGYCVGINEF